MSRPARILFALPLLFAGISACQPAESADTQARAQGSSQVRIDPRGGQCNGQDIHIRSDNFRVLMSDPCGDVTISGNNVRINVEKARSITVEGNDVRVLNREVETLTVNGNRNTLNMTRVGHAEVGGSDNGLLGRHYDSVRFTGSNNYVNTDNSPKVEDRGSRNRVR